MALDTTGLPEMIALIITLIIVSGIIFFGPSDKNVKDEDKDNKQ